MPVPNNARAGLVVGDRVVTPRHTTGEVVMTQPAREGWSEEEIVHVRHDDGCCTSWPVSDLRRLDG